MTLKLRNRVVRRKITIQQCIYKTCISIYYQSSFFTRNGHLYKKTVFYDKLYYRKH